MVKKRVEIVSIVLLLLVVLFGTLYFSMENQKYSLEILNTKSHPSIWRNWTVEFKTNGTGDLRITALNGTFWGEDLKFLKIMCGDKEIEDYQFTEGEIIINNWNCTKIGSEISRVLTSGDHTLKFDFNGERSYAYNAAGSNISIDLISPTPLLINVTQNHSFNVIVNVTCRDVDCGMINVSLILEDAQNIMWNATETDGGVSKGLAITADKLGNVYVAGWWDLDTHNGHEEFFVIKYNSSGSEIWNATQVEISEAHGISVDDLGNVYVAGFFNNEYYTIKYNSSGSEVWNATYEGGVGNELAYAIDIDSLRNVYVTGWKSGDYYTIKYNSSGSEVWNATYDPGAAVTPYGIAVDDLENVYVVGYYTAADRNYYIVKYDALGSQIWNDTYDSEAGGDVAYAVVVDALENVYVTGESSGSSYYTIKYNSSGSQVWNATAFSGRAARAISLDSLGNVYVTGHIGADYHTHTVKFNSSGTEVWNDTYDPGVVAYGIEVDFSGNIYVTGEDSNGDCFTIKYRGYGDLVSTISGDQPFYTNSTNSRSINLSKDESQQLNFWVNATGPIGKTYQLFVYVNDTSIPAIGNVTSRWNVTIINDTTPPSPTSISPATATSTTTTAQTFSYNVSEANVVTNCSLVVNSSVVVANTSIVDKTGGTNTLSYTFPVGVFNWSVNCTDDSGNTGNSTPWTLTITAPASTGGDDGGGGGGGSACISRSWDCGEWTDCIQVGEIEERKRNCTSNCGNRKTETGECVVDCVSDWNCGGWGECVDGKINRECEDLNKCEELKTEEVDCVEDCIFDIVFEDWGECEVAYDFYDLFEKEIRLEGKQRRYYEDKNECVEGGYEERSCEARVDICTRENNILGERYVNVYDGNCEELLTVIKEDINDKEPSLDILIYLEEVEGQCFNRIKDENEKGVDCGGSCEDCFNLDFLGEEEEVCEKDFGDSLELVLYPLLLFLAISYYYVSNKKGLKFY